MKLMFAATVLCILSASLAVAQQQPPDQAGPAVAQQRPQNQVGAGRGSAATAGPGRPGE